MQEIALNTHTMSCWWLWVPSKFIWITSGMCALVAFERYQHKFSLPWNVSEIAFFYICRLMLACTLQPAPLSVPGFLYYFISVMSPHLRLFAKILRASGKVYGGVVETFSNIKLKTVFNCSCNLQIESNNANAGEFFLWHFRRFEEFKFGFTQRSRHLENLLLMKNLHIDGDNRKDGDKIAKLRDRSSAGEQIKRDWFDVLFHCVIFIWNIWIFVFMMRIGKSLRNRFSSILRLPCVWHTVSHECVSYYSLHLRTLSVAIASFLIWLHCEIEIHGMIQLIFLN